MSRTDKILMISEFVLSIILFVLAVLEDSWIGGFCSGVCLIAGVNIRLSSELGSVWSMMKKQNELFSKFLTDIQDLCKDYINEENKEQGGSSGSSSI